MSIWSDSLMTRSGERMTANQERTARRMKARSSQDEQNSARHEQILAIAGRRIASRGYTATTIRDIADEAGILSGSLYHHFSSKDAILSEILHGFMGRLLAGSEGIVAAGGSPREILDELIRNAFVTIEQEPDAVGLYQNESAFLATQPGFEFVGEQSARVEAIWITQITEGQRSGVFRSSFDAAITYRFIRDAVWSTVGWLRPGGSQTAASLSAQLLELIHAGLLTADRGHED
jgi:AcrR family transcriptional regulator